jgi:hypothetical protein
MEGIQRLAAEGPQGAEFRSRLQRLNKAEREAKLQTGDEEDKCTGRGAARELNGLELAGCAPRIEGDKGEVTELSGPDRGPVREGGLDGVATGDRGGSEAAAAAPWPIGVRT